MTSVSPDASRGSDPEKATLPNSEQITVTSDMLQKFVGGYATIELFADRYVNYGGKISSATIQEGNLVLSFESVARYLGGKDGWVKLAKIPKELNPYQGPSSLLNAHKIAEGLLFSKDERPSKEVYPDMPDKGLAVSQQIFIVGAPSEWFCSLLAKELNEE